MAYDERLVLRIKAALKSFPENFTEKKMFGGVAFLLEGKMTIGTINNDLMVRVISSKIDRELQKDFVRPMNFTGKPMKEFVFVGLDGLKSEEDLQYWVELGVEHAKEKLK
ncbi:TfoX/Sxy family protein [Croceitalea sp. MTPC9]|uniref:TfoX/Sxy family protein n=1 Tax=unclassified Croceitalea TaxID=2632280 RepID=UPI002B3E4F03|nr:TfoX/Sxy family protein [Croceitalea sp. MTPC6]GMN16033.1 TfoX/Sxy family protein [Croceitalea sp. MTPC9]